MPTKHPKNTTQQDLDAARAIVRDLEEQLAHEARRPAPNPTRPERMPT